MLGKGQTHTYRISVLLSISEPDPWLTRDKRSVAMNHADAPSQSGVHAVSSSASDTRLHGSLLALARGVWIAMVALTVGLFIAALPMLFRQLQTVCMSATACPSGVLGPTGLQTIHDLGFSVGGYATYTLSLYIATSLVWFAVGLIIFWRRSDDWMALLVALFLVMFNLIPSVGKSLPAFVYPVWDPPLKFLGFLAVIPLGLFFFLFPNGRFVPRWTGWLAVTLLALDIPRSFFPGSPFDFTTWPDGLNVLTVLSLIGTMLFAQVYRYRHVSNPVQRQQTKWVVFGVTTALVVLMAGVLFYLLFPTLSQSGSRYSFFFGTAIPLVLLAIPLSIGIAILRYRLWDIDVIINRTLVYAALSACVIGLYVLVVVGLGSLLQAQGNLLLSLLATGLIAILFQPLRQRLQQAVNRLLYGERDTPYRVISRLGQRLGATLAPDQVLPTIVETVAQVLKLPYVAITLKQEGEFVRAASYGVSRESLTHLPLVYQNEQIGELVLAPRAPGEPFTPADRALLDDLARQTGIAVHAVRLTSDLQRMAADVQRSREQLVTAREEERRRLRRDLHDGLGPALATITVKAEAARDAIAAEPAQAIDLLEELIGQAQAAITDIRRLVYNLRPPALDDLGLVAAIRAQAMHYERTSLRVSIEASEPLPELPAAVEVAAYRIVQEALTNVVRHANARSCLIRLAFDGMLHLEVTDDGCGIPVDRQAGVGLRSMQERAVEVGGSCVVEVLPSKGTRVQASMPCSSDEGHPVKETA